MSMQELNEKLSIINRVVIHPKYRTIGLGARIIRETLSSAGTQYVEMVAVMAKYNPFAEHAGMRNVITKEPPEEALRLAEALKDFSFDLQLLSSERYVRSKLEGLNPTQITALKEAFVKNGHQRFRKEFAAIRHVPYGTTKLYREGVPLRIWGSWLSWLGLLGFSCRRRLTYSGDSNLKLTSGNSGFLCFKPCDLSQSFAPFLGLRLFRFYLGFCPCPNNHY